MKFKKLGNTDLNVSLICLGTMTWGEQNTQAEAFEQMDYSVDQGVNFFDTAELYAVPPHAETYTKTEIMIGNWFAEKHNRENPGELDQNVMVGERSIEGSDKTETMFLLK